MENPMEKEHVTVRMVLLNMRENGKMISVMDKVRNITRMEN